MSEIREYVKKIINEKMVSVGKDYDWKTVEHLEMNEVLDRIKKGVYENQIKVVRGIIDGHPFGDCHNPISYAKQAVKDKRQKETPEYQIAEKFLKSYKTAKSSLPCVTFQGQFPTKREASSADLIPTGFIIADIDNLPKDELKNLKEKVKTDTMGCFFFESPSGYGLKIGYKAEGILNDADNKRFFKSLEYYFNEVYGLQIDKSCKDISRLCFVSYDPDLWINENPLLFDIEKWTPADPPKRQETIPNPPPVSVNPTDLSDSD
jgi:hypothetical protein